MTKRDMRKEAARQARIKDAGPELLAALKAARSVIAGFVVQGSEYEQGIALAAIDDVIAEAEG